jgi:hypothetical protein
MFLTERTSDDATNTCILSKLPALILIKLKNFYLQLITKSNISTPFKKTRSMYPAIVNILNI